MKSCNLFYCSCLLLTTSLSALPQVLPVLNVPMTDLREPASREPRTISLNSVFGVEEIDDQVVRFSSEYNSDGNPLYVDLALFSNRVPLTRANFLNYVNSGAYTNMFFHRSVQDFVVQGGGFRLGASNWEPIPANAPVLNEFGVSNTRGTISMAKNAGNPNSATNQFFVSMGANSDILDPQNGGFTVFGRVTKETMPVMAIFNDPNSFRVWNGSSINSAFGELPLFFQFTNSFGQNYLDYLINFPTVALVPLPAGQAGESTALTYSIMSNSNPSLVTPSVISGTQLQLAFEPSIKGVSTITIRATDSVGNTVDDSFIVNVLESYTTWKNSQFNVIELANSAISGPLGDHEGDKLTNLELFLHGLPRGGYRMSPVIFEGFQGGSARKPRFRFPFRNDIAGVKYEIQRSTSLESDTWATVPHTLISSPAIGNLSTLTIEATSAQATDAKTFYRVAFTVE